MSHAVGPDGRPRDGVEHDDVPASPPRRWRLLLILGAVSAVFVVVAWFAIDLGGCVNEIERWAPCLDRAGDRIQPPPE
ncbi:MAG: hypothetical protein Q4G34_05675 [Micrococcus sp.]|nr:hypothetical protein [Micrococcus sp.]